MIFPSFNAARFDSGVPPTDHLRQKNPLSGKTLSRFTRRIYVQRRFNLKKEFFPTLMVPFESFWWGLLSPLSFLGPALLRVVLPHEVRFWRHLNDLDDFS